MPRRSEAKRYIVTGPGLDEIVPSYADGPVALSRAITAATAAEESGTWYARDSILDTTFGYAERDERGNITIIASGATTRSTVRA